ncbi:hypothetical protein AAG570_000075 [Ranatra chinensis]|uniref:Transposase n=1 Tax=Ranatra chinensis TaxID=642074 RepID=A0ABD0ZCZ3_9HEMI
MGSVGGRVGLLVACQHPTGWLPPSSTGLLTSFGIIIIIASRDMPSTIIFNYTRSAVSGRMQIHSTFPRRFFNSSSWATIDNELVTEKINTKKVCAKLVLTDDQKIRRVAVATELLQSVEMKPDFLNNVITGVGTWGFECSEWHLPESPKPKEARMSKSKGPASEKDIAATRVLHHDNAPSHTALRVRGSTTWQRCHTSPTVPTWHLFPKVKTSLKVTRFGTIEAIQRAATRVLYEVRGKVGDKSVNKKKTKQIHSLWDEIEKVLAGDTSRAGRGVIYFKLRGGFRERMVLDDRWLEWISVIFKLGME